jgi:FtsZ-interacting cell division protein ZipA
LLADRTGAATRAELTAFLHLVADAASALPAQAELPDAAAEAMRAEELDRFCADLDVQIGLTILKGELGQIAGTRLRGVAEAAGFRLGATGQFDYFQEDTGAVLCSLQNYKQEAFTVESLRVTSTPGVVLIIDVPRVADPVRAFDQMRLTAKRLAQTLEAVLVDDNRRPLDDAALGAIRAQVQATAGALREAHIDPGGPRALRLFG